jgi:hypothetical protein
MPPLTGYVFPLSVTFVPVALTPIVAAPDVAPFSTTLPPVPPFTPSVALLVPVIVVAATDPGVVPPIAPGLGSDEVEPPRATDVPAIVIAAFASEAFATGCVANPPLVFTAFPRAVATPVPMVL